MKKRGAEALTAVYKVLEVALLISVEHHLSVSRV